MKKTYIQPSTDIVLLPFNASVLTSVSNTEAASGAEILAPSLPGLDDDELFQFVITHQ